MSRKSIISFIAVGVLAAATLASGAARPITAAGPAAIRAATPAVIGVTGATTATTFTSTIASMSARSATRCAPSTPGPCTCLTKNYTPEGRVVFQDLCTKEMASAPADGSSDQTQNEQGPANMAGQTYQDYLKANPQAAQTQKN